jgi:hypothetical protein
LAVVLEEERLSYRELNRRAYQLAHRLQSIGVGPALLVCTWAVAGDDRWNSRILKAGAAYVPMDLAIERMGEFCRVGYSNASLGDAREIARTRADLDLNALPRYRNQRFKPERRRHRFRRGGASSAYIIYVWIDRKSERRGIRRCPS